MALREELWPWDSQPAGGDDPHIADDAPGRGSIICLLPLNGSPHDIARGRRLTLGSGATYSAGAYGVALQGSGSAAVASIPLDLSSSLIASVSFWMYWNAFANDDDFALEFTSNTFGGGTGFLLDPNASAPSAGKFGILVGRGTAASGNQRSFARPSAAAWHHYAAVLVYGQLSGAAAVPSVWVDGVSQTLSDDFGSGSQAGAAFPSDTLYLFSRANTSLFGAGRMFNLVVRSGYTLTQADVMAEYQRPWSLYEPRRIWVPVSAGGGSVSLTVADATHAHTVDGLALTSATALSVAEALHAHAADAITLVAGSVLAIAEASHAHAADSPTLTAASALAVADATHSHAADNVTLSVAGATNLTVADALHGHAADALALTAASVLAIQDALHAHAADNVTLDASGAVNLLLADGLHAHTADGVALTVAAWLTVADALHGHASDNVVLVFAAPDVDLDAPLFSRSASAPTARVGSASPAAAARRVGRGAVGGPAAH